MTYDEIGNMLTYGTRSFTWEHGRQLASTTKNGVTWTYSYGADGMRTGRTNGTDTYEYVYNGSRLTRMVRNGVTVDFTYINGIPATISFGGNTFYYIVNGQGDVTGITDSEGNLQISFYYGAWGRTYYIYAEGAAYASTLLDINPLMYRGYVFDQETGMYYLQSRYYVPILGRFLNADAFAATGQGLIGNNMFAYCGNNPVNRKDSTGQFWLTALIVTAVVAVCTVSLSSCSTKPTSDMGAASPYTPSSSKDYNCYAYALGEEQWKYVGGSATAVRDFDVDKVAEMVLNDAKKDGRTMRIIDSYDSPIESNEYRIAMRTGKADYHFMVQHNDGTWSHKPGICSTRLIDGTNPSAVSWDAPQIDVRYLYYYGIVREVGFVPNYYNSRTIYFAVTK